MNAHASAVDSRHALQRLWITLSVVLICIGARFIQLPLPVDISPRLNHAALSLASLGTTPFEAGFVFVEWAALIIPAWRRSRTGSPDQRVGLYRMAIIVGVLLSLIQACILELSVRAGGSPPNGAESILRLVAFAGMAFTYIFLAWWVDRGGLGTGFVVVIFANLIATAIVWLRAVGAAVHNGQVSHSAVVTVLIAFVISAGCTLWFAGPNYLPNSDGSDPRLLSRPVCGILPINFVAGLVTFIQLLLSKLQHRANPTFNVSPVALAVITVGSVVAFAYCFHRPRWVKHWWRALLPSYTGPIPTWHSGLLEGLLFAGIISLLTKWLEGRVDVPFQFTPLFVVLLTAFIRELWMDWKRRNSGTPWAPVWDIHQAYATAPALAMLEEAGIRAEAANRHLHGLLQFLGPYAPIRIYVPETDLIQARTLFQQRWPDRADATSR